jgi:death-on-curing protein
MTRYLSLEQVLEAHRQVVAQSGGSEGVRDIGIVESAVAQPAMSFGGQELYPSLEEKAAALGFSLINNHPFVDGNKRIGHAAMATFLRLNGFRISAPVDEAEQFILRIAASEASREELVEWLRAHVVPLG